MNKPELHKSERLYEFLLKFYPKNYKKEFGEEMKYVFSEFLKDAYAENGKQEITNLWIRTILGESKSIFIQYIENIKRRDYMKLAKNDVIMENTIFLWLALATGVILLIPLIVMQFSSEMNWDETDFIIIGILLFGMGSLFVITARMIQSKSLRIAIGVVFVLAVMYIWAELAVGIFTNLGS